MESFLDKNSHIPYYVQLKNLLLTKINNSEFKGGKIYSEHEISNKYNITITTARKALGELKNEGIIYKVKGVGTFINKPKIDINLSDFVLFGKILADKGYTEKIIVLENKIIKFDNKYFNNHKIVNYKNDILNIKRARLINDEAIAIENFFFNNDECKSIKSHDEDPNLYDLLNKILKINFTKIEEYIEPVELNKEESKILKTKEGAAALLLAELVYSKNDTWIFYSKTIIRGDICRYYLRVK